MCRASMLWRVMAPSCPGARRPPSGMDTCLAWWDARGSFSSQHVTHVTPVMPDGPGLSCKRMLAYRLLVADIFKALADPTRRAILDELLDHDGQTLFELCSRLTMKHGLGSSRQAVSQHVDVLESAGLVHRRRSGRYTYHHLDTSPLATVLERWPLPE